jgi:transcriptional regulator with XRE-family HTH domain
MERSVTPVRPAVGSGVRTSAFLGARLRSLREQKGFSQGDMERRSGLLRCYISSVEHSHTVPSIDTLEKMARALDVPMYCLFYEGELDRQPGFRKPSRVSRVALDGPREDPYFLRQLRRQIHRLDERQRSLLLFMARTMARTSAR